MNQQEYWNLFETTGSIDAYLQYACASEEMQLEAKRKGIREDESGSYDGYDTFRSACWRV